ncbi:hypothetical protein F5H01DRAFT_360916 [Linnemannia elongata]|nr:hypothetical protein F5H01DRAFT_360916 [Linnemannia elongata]
MDIFYRAGYIDIEKNAPRATYTYPPAHPWIWKRRGHKVLHLEVHSHGSVGLLEATQSKGLFGCISRVFSDLEELRIKLPSSCHTRLHTTGLPTWHFSSYNPLLSRRFECGLCLFSRLKFLRTLVLS